MHLDVIDTAVVPVDSFLKPYSGGSVTLAVQLLPILPLTKPNGLLAVAF
jgi:hypothetical protein